MPELPEVETIVRDLNRKIIGRRILRFWSNWPKAVKRPAFEKLTREIKGARVKKVSRRAKNILIHLEPRRGGENLLLIHQKMTGHLLLGRWRIRYRKGKKKAVSLIKGPLQDKVNDYVHHIFYLNDGRMLGFSDARKFGKIVFGRAEEIQESIHLSQIGPEPLDGTLTLKKFESVLENQKRKIKQVLMDQKIIAGIGNIYSDEILSRARIHPGRRANALQPREIKRVYKAMKEILVTAIRLHGTSISDFRDTSGKRGLYGEKRLVYGREGFPCARCKRSIKRIRIGGRSARFCPNCQREER